MTELVETAGWLTRAHPRRTVTDAGEVIIGQESALLEILADCVGSTTASKAGGGGGAGSPVDAGALDLLTEIERVVGEMWPGAGDPAYVRVPVSAKLNAWVNLHKSAVAEAALLDLCRQWVAKIRAHIEPEKRMALQGAVCPVCGWDRHPVEREGEWVYLPTLVAFPEAQPVRVECTYPDCPATEERPNVWAGRDVTDTFLRSVTVESVVM